MLAFLDIDLVDRGKQDARSCVVGDLDPFEFRDSVVQLPPIAIAAIERIRPWAELPGSVDRYEPRPRPNPLELLLRCGGRWS